MAKKVAQVRYYGPKDIKNYPKDNNTKNRYVSGNIFNQYYPIKQLGIQTLPGTKFYLNNNKDYPIIVGYTGIYELELNDNIEIYNLAFEAQSMKLIGDNPSSYLIIDIIYDEQEG